MSLEIIKGTFIDLSTSKNLFYKQSFSNMGFTLYHSRSYCASMGFPAQSKDLQKRGGGLSNKTVFGQRESSFPEGVEMYLQSQKILTFLPISLS